MIEQAHGSAGQQQHAAVASSSKQQQQAAAACSSSSKQQQQAAAAAEEPTVGPSNTVNSPTSTPNIFCSKPNHSSLIKQLQKNPLQKAKNTVPKLHAGARAGAGGVWCVCMREAVAAARSPQKL